MPRSHLLDVSPLRANPAYARMWSGQAIGGIGGQLTIVAVGLHIYELTRSTLAVALVGVIALGPTVLAGLYGGALADALDRRRLAILAASVAWASTGTIAVLAWLGAEQVGTLYVLTAITAAASTVLSATSAAITPRLLPRELLPAASALGGISSGIAITVGPAIAGVLVAAVGYAWTYSLDVVLFVAAFTGIVTLPALAPDPSASRPGLRSVTDGLRFLTRAPNIRMNFLVDIVAMVFGQPRVLFPALAALVLGGGPVTVGLLTASFAAGALLSGLFSGRLGEVRAHGRAIGFAVEAYGAAILGFGLVVAFSMLLGGNVGSHGEPASTLPLVLAGLLLAAAGAADNVSAVYRSTMLQAAVPDVYRGRLQGVFIVVVTGGPRIGDLYVGLTASLGLLWLPPVAGGVLILVLVALLVARSRSFRSYDSLAPQP
ncbi:MFS transporter [Naasia aerilata]|uniref:MFS transporter n=1 Tax=Naasia aerilata TaxID=1162966 RepID=A0ABN6XRG7_9MICO|nr:MFS transporter [Naasia aerilata]BDZ47632.1 MFS transporter [Naasia aerilata]